jgi:hypothetical protein
MTANLFGPPQSSPSTVYNGNYRPDTFESEALSAVQAEMGQWYQEEVFLTDRVSYVMRNVILRSRKNYFGIFDVAFDEITGDEKFWMPITEWSVENVVKSVDLDMKDIMIQPGTPEAVHITPVIRAIILAYLKKTKFGQLLNDAIRVMARDGTVVVKVYDDFNVKSGKREIHSEIVDLLNFWIDPNADNIQDASAVIQRSVLSKDQIDSYRGVWKNIDSVPYSLNITRVYQDWGGWSMGRGDVPYTEVYERWGKIKKSWVTKKTADENTWIEGHMVFAGSGGPQILMMIRENPRKDGIKPYEEGWYKKIDGRWFGRGISEMLFHSQMYANEIVNTRRTNNKVLQNGLFLVRKGSGIVPDQMNSMTAGGGIFVTDLNRDIKQLQVQDYRQSSYKDEEMVGLYSDRVTGSFDIGRGEAGRASTSATATLTQDRNIRDTFVLVQEGIGFFIERLIVRQFIPLLQKTLTPESMVRITGEIDSLDAIDQTVLENRTDNFKLDYASKKGFMPSEAEVADFQDKQKKVFGKQGKRRFAEYWEGLFDAEIDIDVNITDERMNRVVVIQQLNNMLTSFSRLPVATRLNTDAILDEMLNLMGMKGEFFLNKPQVPALSAEATQAGRLMKNPPEGPPTDLGAFQNAQGLPQMGQQAPPQTNAIPAAAGAPGIGQIPQ